MKKKWYDYILITIAIVICYFHGHEWVEDSQTKYCRCCGKTIWKQTCINCNFCHTSTNWCKKNKVRLKSLGSSCEKWVPRLNINRHG